MEQNLYLLPAAGVHPPSGLGNQNRISTSASLAKFVCEPRFRRSPVAQNRGLGDVQQFGCFADVKTSEETAFDHQSLTWLEFCQFVESAIQGQQVLPD